MANRFDFEQKLIKFSTITEDLQELNSKNPDLKLQHIIDYYNDQYENLWAMFEQMIQDKQIR